MSTILQRHVHTPQPKFTGDDDLSLRRRTTIQTIVDGFATQKIERIMAKFTEDGVFCDIFGDGPRGKKYGGVYWASRNFERQFVILGTHTYEYLTIVVTGVKALANRSLVYGYAEGSDVPNLDGIDHFEFDNGPAVTLRKACFKGHSYLSRILLRRSRRKNIFLKLGL